MKTTLFVLMSIFLLASVAHADELVLTAPVQVPTLIPYSLRADLPDTDVFTEASVYLDEEKAATVYPSGYCLVQPEWAGRVLACTTFDADPSSNGGLTLIFAHTGFSKGEHSVRVSTVGTVSETQSLNVISDDVLGGAKLDEIKASMVDVENQLIQIKETMSSYADTISSLQNQLSQNQQLSESQRNELQNLLNQAQAKLEEQQSMIATLENQLSGVEDEVARSFKNPFATGTTATAPADETQPAEVPQEGNDSPLTGFATGGNAPLIGVAILVIACALAFFYFRGRAGNSGGNPGGAAFFEGSVDALFKGTPKQSDEGLQPRKFASISREEARLRQDIENNPPEKVNFSELIRKERD